MINRNEPNYSSIPNVCRNMRTTLSPAAKASHEWISYGDVDNRLKK